MKHFLPLIFAFGLASVASAAPYIVYSGTTTGTFCNTAGEWKTSQQLFVITDLQTTSTYAVYLFDPIAKQGQLFTYPIANPSAEQLNSNFFGGILAADGKSGGVVLNLGFEAIDASDNVYVTRFYGTGALVMKNTVLVPARTKPVADITKLNGVAQGELDFPVSAAVSTGGLPFPVSVSGTMFTHVVAADGTLQKSSLLGAFTLKQNAQLTSLANIGGVYSANRQNSIGVLPISQLIVNSTLIQAFTNYFAELSDAMLAPLTQSQLNPGVPSTGSVAH